MLQAQHLSTPHTQQSDERATNKLSVINVQDDIQETMALIEVAHHSKAPLNQY